MRGLKKPCAKERRENILSGWQKNHEINNMIQAAKVKNSAWMDNNVDRILAERLKDLTRE